LTWWGLDTNDGENNMEVINTHTHTQRRAGSFLLLRKTQTLDMGDPIKRISVLSKPSNLRST
jgi:hypothetical protein